MLFGVYSDFNFSAAGERFFSNGVIPIRTRAAGDNPNSLQIFKTIFKWFVPL